MTLVERETPGAGASSVAAGMLAPVSELDYAETAALAGRLAALERWPAFARELAEASGVEPALVHGGSVIVAVDRDDAAELRRLHDLHRSLGVASQWLDRRALRAHVPELGPRALAALSVAEESAVDPEFVVAALATAARRAGAELRERAAATELRTVEGRVRGVLLADGTEIAADLVVVATGARTRQLLPGSAVARSVRPVKGQLLTVAADGRRAQAPRIVVRTPRVYLVPRGDGRVVIGATQEERGFDSTVTAGALRTLLEEAWEVWPGVDEAQFLAAKSGHRPATPDNEPIVGFDPELGGLFWATGHWRNGVLWTSLVGDVVRDLVLGREPAIDPSPYAPARFVAAATANGAPVPANPAPAFGRS